MKNCPADDGSRHEYPGSVSGPDDEERARRLIRRQAQEGEPVHISLLVLLETEWVLRSRYKFSKGEILGTFSELLSAMNLSFEDESSVEEAHFVWKDSPAQARGLSHRCSASNVGMYRNRHL